MRSAVMSAARVCVLMVGCAVCLAVLLSPALAGTAERITMGYDGCEPNGESDIPVLSADGRFVAFVSRANNLVPGDTNGWTDVFVYDRVAHTTERASVSSEGAEANGDCYRPSISGDGRLVTFDSSADNLTPGDTWGTHDVFLRDRLAGTTVKLTVSTQPYPGGGVEPDISGDGRFVAFVTSDRTYLPGLPTGGGKEEFRLTEISVKDLLTGVFECPSYPYDWAPTWDGDCGDPSLSADGRLVLFKSAHRVSDPAGGDHPFGIRGIYLRDRLTGLATLVAPIGGGEFPDTHMCMDPYRNPHISSGGQYVAFHSCDDGLVPDDNNWLPGVFLRDVVTGTTERLDAGLGGAEATDCSSDADVSGDGRYVVFASCATNLVSDSPAIGAPQVFLRDRLTGSAQIASLGSDGTAGDRCSWWPAISADGSTVAFPSRATNLLPGDTNGLPDIYVYCSAPPGNTQPGTDVLVQPGEGIELTFAEVTEAGSTTVTVSENPPGGPPSGFRFLGSYYDIATTAGYSGDITISLPYDPEALTGKTLSKLTVFHFRPGTGWEDVAVSVDTVNHRVIVTVTGLSWFGLAYPAYQFRGFLPPIADIGDKSFKRGSTIPIKFRISSAAGAPVTDAIARLTLHYLGAGAPPGEPAVVSTAAGDLGNQFRYDPAEDLYMFNLSTNGPSFLGYSTYQAEVTLDDDGQHSADFSLK